MRCLVVPSGVSILAVVAALLPAGRAPAADAPTPAPTMEVAVGEGRLSVNLRDALLADVLRLIGQEARLKVHLDGQLRTPITGTFTGLPLEAGIRRLTRGHSSTFAYDPPPHPGHAPRLTEIWIIESSPAVGPATPVDPRVRAARLASVGRLGQRQDDGAVAELSRILAQDPDPVVRTRAALALSRPRDTRASPALTAALDDQHPSRRGRAGGRGARPGAAERSRPFGPARCRQGPRVASRRGRRIGTRHRDVGRRRRFGPPGGRRGIPALGAGGPASTGSVARHAGPHDVSRGTSEGSRG
jgi:hypothetical protein